MIRILGLMLACALLIPALASAQDFKLYHEIAAYHAPVIFQKVGHYPKGDSITHFGFDGDMVGNNNWKNLESNPTPAYVYFDVRETKTHYFIMYALFHARDYSYFCIPWVCHENDLEGAMLTIQKTENWWGRLVMIQTLAHDKIYTHEISSIKPMGTASGGRKASLFVEWGGHGIYSWDALESRKHKEGMISSIYYMDEIMKAAETNYTKKWFVYHYTGTPDDPKGASEGVYGYDLLPIWDNLWAYKDVIAQTAVFSKKYDYSGSRFQVSSIPEAFSGQKWGNGRARPPWAWKDVFTSKAENRGDWFLDPALYISTKMKNVPRSYSTEYVFNPYVN